MLHLRCQTNKFELLMHITAYLNFVLRNYLLHNTSSDCNNNLESGTVERTLYSSVDCFLVLGLVYLLGIPLLGVVFFLLFRLNAVTFLTNDEAYCIGFVSPLQMFA